MKPQSFRAANQENALTKAMAKGVIIKPEDAAERERVAEIIKVQAHLDSSAEERGGEVALFQSLLLAEVQRVGLHAADVEQARRMARDINEKRKVEKWLAVAELLAELGITELGEPQAHMSWCAKKVGVDLTPEKDAPRLEG